MFTVKNVRRIGALLLATIYVIMLFPVCIVKGEEIKDVTVYMSEETPFVYERLAYNIFSSQDITVSIIRQAEHSLRESVEGNINSVAVGKEFDNLTEVNADFEEYKFFRNSSNSDIDGIIQSGLNIIKDNGVYNRIKEGSSAKATGDRTVFILGSYSNEMKWQKDFSAAVNKSFEDEAEFTSIYCYEMGFRRSNNKATLYKGAEDFIRANFVNEFPDIIITSDNDALNFINEYHAKYFPEVPVVFAGVNFFTEDLISNISDYTTGIVETTIPDDTIDLALKLNPKYKRIYLVCDNTVSASGIKKYAYEEISEKYGDRFEIIQNKKESLQATVNDINSYDKNTLVVLLTYYIDGTDKFYTEEQLVTFLEKNIKYPIYTKMTAFTGSAAMVGGVMSNSTSFGKGAAEIAKSILDGENVKNIPIITEEQSVNIYDTTQFDYSALQHFGIDEKLLPKNAVIVNKPVNGFNNNPKLLVALITSIIAAVVIGVIFIVFSIIINKRNKALVLAQENLVEKDRLIEFQTKITEGQNFINTIVDLAPYPFSMNLDGRIISYNQVFTKTFGFFSEDDTLEKIYANHDVLKEVDKLAAAGVEIKNKPVILNSISGEKHFLLSASKTVYNGVPAVIHWATDVDDLEKRTDNLRQTNNLLRDLIFALPVPLCIVRKEDNKLRLANSAFTQLGKTYNVILSSGENYTDILQKYYDVRDNSFQKVIDTFGIHFVWSKTLVNGEILNFNLTCGEAYFENELSVIMSVVDITAQVKQELLLKNAAEKEKAANTVKSLFVANMSHEMRTPLNAIIGMSTVALASKDMDKILGCINKIHDASQHLLGEINDVLDMSKIEAGKMELVNEEFEFTKNVSKVVDMLMFKAGEKQIKIATELDPVIPHILIGDEQKISQVMTNLLNNAVKFTPQGGEVKLSAELVDDGIPFTLELPNGKKEESAAAEIKVTITDSGIGITDEQLKKLFKPFEQADNTTSRNFGGTGLGLTISKSIVELMQGEIHVESQFGKGSKFTFTFKMPGKNLTAIETEQAEEYDFSDYNILIAEDVEMNREVISMLLEDTGIHIEFAENGNIALEKFSEKSESFDLIFMDIHMPLMDGYEATRRIRELLCKNAQTIPIIAMTANVFKEDISKCFDAGMNGHVGKPIDIRQVKKTLKQFL